MTTERQFCANCLYIRSQFCPKKMKTMNKLCSRVLGPTVHFSMGVEDGFESTTFPCLHQSPRSLEASHCWPLGWACPEFHPEERNFVPFNMGHFLEDYLTTTIQVSWLWECTIILGGQMVWPHSPLLWSVELHLHKYMHLQSGEEHPKSLSLGSHPSLPLRPSGLGVFDSEWKNLLVCVWKSLSHVWLFATLYSPWTSPGQNIGVGSLSLLQGIFPTQGLNPGLPYCRWTLSQLSHKGSP